MGDCAIDLTFALKSEYYITHPGPWAGHIPFAHWLMGIVKPNVLVELGTYRGNSYFNFCQAIKDNRLPTRAFAIDTWEGDVHSGFYGDHIYTEVSQYNAKNFSDFSTLIKGTFAESLDKFTDCSIDILHIDGLHTYEAVKQDFEKWLPKLSLRGIILLHDITVYQSDFGVWKFFDEMKSKFPTFWFNHSNGLGVIMVGEEIPDQVRRLDASHGENDAWKSAVSIFTKLGSFCERESEAIYRDFLASEKNCMQASQAEDERRILIQKASDDLDSERRRVSQLSEQLTAAIRCRDEALSDLHRYDVTHRSTLFELLSEALTVQDNFALFRREAEAFKKRIHELEQQASVNRDEIKRKDELLSRQHDQNIEFNKKTSDNKVYGVKILFRKIKTFSRLVLAGEIKKIGQIAFARNTKLLKLSEPERGNLFFSKNEENKSIYIVSTHHTTFIAHSLASSLMSYGFDVHVSVEMPEVFESDLYFVVCAQMFERLPPADRRICVQLEQAVMSRWFTQKYNQTLRESLAVLEYTHAGIKFLDGLDISYPKVYYLPVRAVSDYVSYLRTKGVHLSRGEKEYDVLFYGDSYNLRRNKFLEKIGSVFRVKVINNLFGDELYAEILKSKVCINIHYYENSALESTRVFEILSLGVPVVSELSSDQADYDFSLYRNSIRFTEEGNVDAMVEAIRAILDEDPIVPTEANRKSAGDFHFYVGRLLLNLDKINFKRFYSQCNRIVVSADKIVLSLPETFERRAALQRDDVFCFSGLRARPGWVGAAYSFKYLAKKLLESGCEFVLIHEDDAVFPNLSAQEILDFAKRVYHEEYKWDIFSAFISDLHNDAKIESIFKVDGIECVVTDRTVGMVCNVYTRKSLEIISQWDENNLDLYSNTIDRYIENIDNLKIVTTLPFLAEHNEMAHSSMWGVKNYTMRNMINASKTLLFEKVWRIKAEKMIRKRRVDLVS